MIKTDGEAAPAWVARFLDSVRAGNGVRAACRAAGVTSSTPYHRRKIDQAFCAAWDACRPADGPRKRPAGPKAPRDAARIERFLDELAETSNVAASAAVADIALGKVYRLRRTDPDFARRWYVALAEGYDNLEMELLRHLRSGGIAEEPAGAADGTKRKFDPVAALRSIVAHRESVAREKGRRTLADEVTTIAAINAKIDELRARAKQGEAAIRRARKATAIQTAIQAKRPDGDGQG